MLILTRKDKECIRIGNDIYIYFLECKNKSVRVGIDAPDDVNIVRTELLVKKEEGM